MGGSSAMPLSRSLCLRRPAHSSRSDRPITNTNPATSSIEAKNTGEARRHGDERDVRAASVGRHAKPTGIDGVQSYRLG